MNRKQHEGNTSRVEIRRQEYLAGRGTEKQRNIKKLAFWGEKICGDKLTSSYSTAILEVRTTI
jgi:hypothetical protein